MTSAPTKPPVLKGIGDVDLSLRSGGISFVDTGTAVPEAPTWASRVRPGSGALQPSLSQETVDRAIEEMELRQLYGDSLTEEEWKAIHNPDDREEHGFTVAEAQRLGDLKAKWVKSIGGPVHVEEKNGVKAETWVRGDRILFEITQPNGEKHKWQSSTKSALRYHLGEKGEVIRTGREYRLATYPTKETFFVDCSISDKLPHKSVPIGGEVNNRKGRIGAAVKPNGQIIINPRGVFKDHQFVAKTHEGAFVTVDSKGNPMLANLDKLPSNVPLTDQDRKNHEAIAQQIRSGERSVTEFVRLRTALDGEVVKASYEDLLPGGYKGNPDIPRSLRILSDLDRRGALTDTSHDLDMVLGFRLTLQRPGQSR